MLRNRIDKMTPDDIAEEKGEPKGSPFFFIYEVSYLEFNYLYASISLPLTIILVNPLP